MRKTRSQKTVLNLIEIHFPSKDARTWLQMKLILNGFLGETAIDWKLNQNGGGGELGWVMLSPDELSEWVKFGKIEIVLHIKLYY